MPVQIIVGSKGENVYQITPDRLFKAGGWLLDQFQFAQQRRVNERGSGLLTIDIPHEDALTVLYFIRVLEAQDGQTMDPPEIYVEFANKWPTLLDAVIDVYALANRLGSEYAQNKMMDSLMIILRNPVVRRGQRLTFTLTRFRDDGEETRKSRLADFLVDCVAFCWLTNPAVGLVDPHAVCHQDILSAQSYVRVLVNIGNKYILERLMLQVIKMHISTIFSGSRGRHPAEQVLCTYHVHGTSQVPCASCVGLFM